MASPFGEKAISDALNGGNALLKFISQNDVGATGGHQCGFYLPKSAWRMFTPNPPTKGINSKHEVKIEWPDGRITDSVVTWYGKGTRSEYRLTKFQKGFPWLTPETVGNLLVLIPKSQTEFIAHVLDLEDDIEEMLASLGVAPFEHWAIYQQGVVTQETQDQCLRRMFLEFSKDLTVFPTGKVFSKATWDILQHCIGDFGKSSLDDALLTAYETEYQLFRTAERQICSGEIVRLFKDIDDFLNTANTILNRRKSRAGHSLENHVDYIMDLAKIPHQVQPRRIDGKPDIVVPDEKAYFNSSYPEDKLFIIGVKTTCKDRWRQVLNEGVRVKRKYIVTLQPGISASQLTEMYKSGVSLVVPRKLHKEYPKGHPIELLDLETFSTFLTERLNT